MDRQREDAVLMSCQGPWQGRAGQGRAGRGEAGQGRAGEGVSTDQRHKASSLTGMMCKGLASVV